MGRFTYQIKESCWREVYVRFDDDDLNNCIREWKDDGYTQEQIRQMVIEYLKECDDEDYGDGLDYETEDWDYDAGDDESVYSVADEYIDSFECEDIELEEPRCYVIGGLPDD